MKRKRLSVLYVEKKAARRLPTQSGALGPVMAITTVEADFPMRDSSVVSHMGCPARANPEWKVVNSVAISSIEYEVGIPCTRRCVTGVSSWTLTVPGMKWRKEPTLLLSTVAFVDSIVVRVTVSPFTVTICTYVPARALFIVSRRSSADIVSGGPSRLTMSRLSLVVGAIFSGGRAIVGGPVVLVVLSVFLPFLTTVFHKGVWAGGGRRVGSGGFGSGLTSKGFVSATLKGIGVGVSG